MEMLNCRTWQRPSQPSEEQVRRVVAEMVALIARDGDSAISAKSQAFDGFKPYLIELKPWRDYPLDPEFQRHLEIAARRIQTFALRQRESCRDMEWQDETGVYGHRRIPLDSMAAYIPGGRFPLVSTALMTLIPAKVAGVPIRLAMSPSAEPAILAAASLAGATAFLRIGGAQAIAAAAMGSSWHAAVDMVVGPGNAYVNAAKALLQDRVKIDTLAGPSEILVLCDDSVDPAWVAEDILAQAEHDPMALSVLAATNATILEQVADYLKLEKQRQPEKELGVVQLVLGETNEDLVALANAMGPEHLLLACREGAIQTDALRHYGSLFIGAYSAVALGDYCSGPNHTLPTLGYARCKGGLQVGDFLKTLTYQAVSPGGFDILAPTAMALAQEEGLVYHHRSLAVRQASTPS